MLRNITIIGLGAMGILFGDAAVKHLGPDRVRFLADGDRPTGRRSCWSSP